MSAAAVEEVLEAMEKSEVAAHADSGFDAGEFSGPAHTGMLNAKIQEIATKFQMPVESLLDEVYEIGSR